jgi:GDP-D-mannose dehydratase
MHTKAFGIVGASGKHDRYMVHHYLGRGLAVHGVCRHKSVVKLEPFKVRIKIRPGPRTTGR